MPDSQLPPSDDSHDAELEAAHAEARGRLRSDVIRTAVDGLHEHGWHLDWWGDFARLVHWEDPYGELLFQDSPYVTFDDIVQTLVRNGMPGDLFLPAVRDAISEMIAELNAALQANKESPGLLERATEWNAQVQNLMKRLESMRRRPPR